MRIISLKSLLLLLFLACFQFPSLGEENLPIPFLSLDASGRAPWNMLGHDARHTGRNPFMGLLNGSATTKGRFELGESRSVSSPSVGSDGTIYFGSGYLFAFQPNGKLKWKFNDFFHDEYLTPAIGKDGTIYAISVCDYACDVSLHAIDSRGRLKWKRPALSEPTLDVDGTVYFTSSTGRFVYLSAVKPDGSLKWRRRIASTRYSRQAVAIGIDGNIYLTLAGTIYALGRGAGNVLWSHKTEAESLSIPSIGANNTIYASGSEHLYSVSSSGKLKWKLKLAKAWGPLAIGIDGTIYITAVNGDLFAVNTNGTRKWKYSAGSKARTSPVIDKDNVIYFGTATSIHSVTSSGKLRWKVDRSASGLCLANGRLYAVAPGKSFDDFNGVFFAVR